MCSCKRSADRRFPRRLRGLTLIELMVAQVIVGVIAAGMFALIGGMTRSFHEEQGATEAQVRLREASSVMLRTLQGIGGSDGRAGHLVLRDDGGDSAADSLTIFSSDYGVCGGSQPVVSIEDGDKVLLAKQDFDGDTLDDCPVDTMVGCRSADLIGRVLLIEGATRSAQLLITEADVAACTLTLGSSAVQSLQVAAYNQHFSATASGPAGVLTQLGDMRTARFGASVTFSVDPYTESLVRSINGAAPTKVLDGIYDLQVVTAHDLPPGDGAVAADEWNHDGALADATPENFFGVRVGLITYGSARAGIVHGAPRVFANRFHSDAPGGRRYRYSWIFAAARNR